MKKIIDKGVKVSAGTDATRVASYNPWVSLAWSDRHDPSAACITPPRNCLDRETALVMWTENVTWFLERGRQESAGSRSANFADLIVPDRDYFCAGADIDEMASDLTVVGGKARVRGVRFQHFHCCSATCDA